MQRISKLTLKNFKFFHGEVTIDFDRKNLLIYGENGSGKSGISCAISTFFQSVLKADIATVRKDFDPKSGENFINIYASNQKETSVQIILNDGKTNIDKKVSLGKTTTRNVKKIREIAEVSDFFNYKFLYQIHNFPDNKEIDLFPMFERDILQFVSFRKSLVRHDGHPGNSNAREWFRYISTGIPATLKKRSNGYKLFNTAVDEFNVEMRFYIESILQTANDYLRDKFKEPFRVILDYKNGLIISLNKRYYAYTPEIGLRAEILNSKLSNGKHEITYPQDFLNEARLTSLALAIRFAVLNERYIKDVPRILVLDDFLISLDMSNRDNTIDIVFDEFANNSQLLILTHDRAFFNICKNRIKDRYGDKNWVFKEIYQHETEKGIPCPFVPEQKDYLDLANKYLKEFDYPASANYLRKETERLLKYLLPKNLSLTFKEDKGTEVLKLDNLIVNFLKYIKELGSDSEAFRKLKEYKDLLLNPLSHDNTESPIYRRELENVILLLTDLRKLRVSTIGLPDADDEMIFWLCEKDSSGDDWNYEFSLKETFRGVKDLDGNWLLSDPLCRFLARQNMSKTSPKEEVNKEVKLAKGYDQIRYALGIKTTTGDNAKDLKEIIFRNDEKLADMLNA